MAKRRSKKMKLMAMPKGMGRGGVMLDTPLGQIDFPVGSLVKSIMAGPGKTVVSQIKDFMKNKGAKMSSILPNLKPMINRISSKMVKDGANEALEGVIDGFKAVGGRRKKYRK
jgi:hypothetical protein